MTAARCPGDSVHAGAAELVHLHHPVHLPVLPAAAGLAHRGPPPQDTRPQARLRQAGGPPVSLHYWGKI